MMLLEWVLIQSHRGLYKRKFGQTKVQECVCTKQRHVRIQYEDGYLQTKERELRRNQPADTLNLDF